MKKNDNTAVNAIRILAAEAIEKAKSGHPGLPMGIAPTAYTLWAKHLKHNPKNTKWMDRDRFVLSAGHGSMLIYSLLHLFGYGLTIDDLKNFRQFGSLTPGHPEYGHTDGVEITTGPLGQGIANAVGMAMAESFLAQKFNREGYNIFDHYTYALCGDGCMMEGISSEAASLAGTLKLDKLIVLYDSNGISIEGSTDIAFCENTGKRFESYGWNVLTVEDGNDLDLISAAISKAKENKKSPSLIVIKTQIGYGCPAKQGKASIHGEPLGEENIKATKEFLGWKEEPFSVPKEVYETCQNHMQKNIEANRIWEEMKAEYKNKFPEDHAKLEQWFYGKFTEIPEDLPYWFADSKPAATRSSSEVYLNRISDVVENLIGGSADLAPSNKSYMKGRGDFGASDRSGRNLHFGVREHAMAAISNGIAVHGGLKAYCATFFVFCDYMKHSMRLASLMGLPVTYILTHDSIGVGEDGPTHQPVEQLAMLRSIPNMVVYRPADAREAAYGWYLAMKSEKTPTSLILSRQNLPLNENSSGEALKGAYIIKKANSQNIDAVIIATGSEVAIACEAAVLLEKEGIYVNVISMPSMELFEMQDEEYKEKILPKKQVKRIAVEAASSFGWHKYTGTEGKVISIDTFGASGPADILYKKFGFTAENIAAELKRILP